MKTTPDETTITLWIDGKLEGEELVEMETWAKDQPELLAERDAIRAISSQLADTIPASEEPPYSDFFNQRILRHIEEESPFVSPAKPAKEKINIWRWLAIPAAAAAMTACFYMGLRSGAQTGTAPQTMATAATVYTPDENVSAAIISSESADVIVLNGLSDIPDSHEIIAMNTKENEAEKGGAALVTTEFVY